MKKKQDGEVILSENSNVDVYDGTGSNPEENMPKKEGKAEKGILVFIKSTVTGIASLCLIFFSMLLVLLEFFRTLSAHVTYPDIGFVESGWITGFFESPFPLILGIPLALLPLLFILVANLKKIRGFFFATGISYLAAGIVTGVLGCFGATIVGALPGDWKAALVYSTDVFRDYTAVWSFVMIAAGVFGLFVRACINGAKAKTVKGVIIKTVISFMLLLVFLIIGLGTWQFFVSPKLEPDKTDIKILESEPGIIQLAEESEQIDVEESEGIIYMNNEVIVFLSATATKEETDALFAEYKANVDASMGDIGVYRLTFATSMSYDELEDLIKELKSNAIVDDAYLNIVTEVNNDTKDEEDDFDYKEAVFPNDPWKHDGTSEVWDVAVPGGTNWGVEAIDAPGAWAYLDGMSTVKVGLIDTMPENAHSDLDVISTSLFIDEKTGETETNKYSVVADDHGTHVGGTINALYNNSNGLSGVMGGKGELYHCKAYYESGGNYTVRFGTAYSYLLELKTLIDQDVQVINISQNTSRLIGFAASHGNQNAINYLSLQAELAEKGLLRIIEDRQAMGKSDFVICVAAGNSNSTYYYKDDNAQYGYREEKTLWEAVKSLFGWEGEKGGSLALYNNFLNLMDEEAVKARVIVVGAVGIDYDLSTTTYTQYEYAYFSNEGSRVDIVAPGMEVYSCIPGSYDSFAGTSMATPHVTGVAGLIFAANPELTGPDVKEILVNSTTGRYYHGDDYSGLLNANMAVVNSLKTEGTTVEKVIRKETDNGLDLCFVVDTTGSMGDDIDNAKENMSNILSYLAEKTENYRVALVDYRDFADRTGRSEDYPAKVQLAFSDDDTAITNAINSLSLGNGGDDEETVYSGLMAAVGLDWRADAKKVIIVLGDAAPLDPEPVTDYTYDEVLLAIFNADISISLKDSDERVTGTIDEALINVFTIGTDASGDASDFFSKIAEGTGGSYADVDDASKVSDAIMDSIEQIEIEEKIDARADFGKELANQKITLYSGKEYLFTVETDENGRAVLEAMEENSYKWLSNNLYGGGSIDISAEEESASVRIRKEFWFTPILEIWQSYKLVFWGVLALAVTVAYIIPVIISYIACAIRKKKAKKAEAAETGVDTSPVMEIKGTKLTPANEMVCKNCGNPYTTGEIYCGKCGATLES